MAIDLAELRERCFRTVDERVDFKLVHVQCSVARFWFIYVFRKSFYSDLLIIRRTMLLSPS